MQKIQLFLSFFLSFLLLQTQVANAVQKRERRELFAFRPGSSSSSARADPPQGSAAAESLITDPRGCSLMPASGSQSQRQTEEEGQALCFVRCHKPVSWSVRGELGCTHAISKLSEDFVPPSLSDQHLHVITTPTVNVWSKDWCKADQRIMKTVLTHCYKNRFLPINLSSFFVSSASLSYY